VTTAARPPGTPEPRRRSRLARLFGRGSDEPEPGPVDDGRLRTVARAFDAARGDAAVVDDAVAAGLDLAHSVLLRHVFAVHESADTAALIGGLAADGYDLRQPSPGRLTAAAAVLLTPLTAAQARARMTGLTTRHPVDYLGWEVLDGDG
jgi:hypothetical protein